MSGLLPLRGHGAERASLGRAVDAGDLPGSLLLHGPRGIGKQRLALWLGQLLLCDAPEPGEPCGRCRACRLTDRLEHPDLYWFFPLPRPRSSGSAERLAAALEDARAEELSARRAEPLYDVVRDGATGIYLAQVKTIRQVATAPPAMAKRKVVVVGDAERMVPQESSPAAANAFLKILEEPPARTHFVITASDPEALLPTILSRVLRVRMRPLSEDDVASFLTEFRGVDDEGATAAARLAEGSIGRALGFLPGADGEPGPLDALRRDAWLLLKAAAAEEPGRRLAAAHSRQVAGSRGEFLDVLGFLAGWIRDVSAARAGAESAILNADAADAVRQLADRLPLAAQNSATALNLVEEARDMARGNVNPQLITAWLLRRLHGTLAGETVAPELSPLHSLS